MVSEACRAGSFSLWPARWTGGGQVAGGVACRVREPGLHTAALRVLSATGNQDDPLSQRYSKVVASKWTMPWSINCLYVPPPSEPDDNFETSLSLDLFEHPSLLLQVVQELG